MEKTATIIVVLMIVGIVFLSGCNDNILEKIEYKIGESVIFENINYTFLSAYWNDSKYILEIKGENVGNKEESSNVIILQYEMKNGNIYKPLKVFGFTAKTFNLKTGRNDILTFTDYSSIDKECLPVAKIYLELYSPGGNLSFPENAKTLEIKIL